MNSLNSHVAARTRATVPEMMLACGVKARGVARQLALVDGDTKKAALMQAAVALRAAESTILGANALDVADMKAANGSPAFIDRLTLNEERVAAMAQGVEAIAQLDDPVGSSIARWRRPNGLDIERVRTPLGVIGVIYESRPNVTADAAALCLKAGNSVILRGGSDSYRSSGAIHAAFVDGIVKAGLPADAVQMVPVIDRAAVGEMLSGLNGNLDVIIPRGGKGLVERVQREARVPVFAHLEGLCHVFIDRDADLDMARDIVVNAKLRRTGICGAAETLLVDAACADTHLKPLVAALIEAGCAVRGDAGVREADARVSPAQDEDWTTEYLAPVIAARIVRDVDEAIDHIERFGSHHTDCIVTGNSQTAEYFLKRVDSAIVLVNASTQFADGGEFGMGAEIGIATGRMHARGPVGVEQLTSFKYKVRGSGQTRP